MSKAVYPVQFDVPHNGLEYLEYYSAHKVYHPGWDLNQGYGNQDFNNDVVCPVTAVVQYVSPTPSVLNGQNGGFGLFLILYHPEYNVWSRYAHLESVSVKQGDHLKTDDHIANVGNSGTVSAHMHFEVFGLAMQQIQESFWRGPYRYYPSSKSKKWVADHYLDGLKFIDDINAAEDDNGVSDMFKEAQKFVQDRKISNGEAPHELLPREQSWEMFMRNYDNIIAPLEQKVYELSAEIVKLRAEINPK